MELFCNSRSHTAAGRSWGNFKGFEDCHLKSKAKPGLDCLGCAMFARRCVMILVSGERDEVPVAEAVQSHYVTHFLNTGASKSSGHTMRIQSIRASYSCVCRMRSGTRSRKITESSRATILVCAEVTILVCEGTILVCAEVTIPVCEVTILVCAEATIVACAKFLVCAVNKEHFLPAECAAVRSAASSAQAVSSHHSRPAYPRHVPGTAPPGTRNHQLSIRKNQP